MVEQNLTIVIGVKLTSVSAVLKLTPIASTPSIGLEVIVTVISSVEEGLARVSSYVTSPVYKQQTDNNHQPFLGQLIIPFA